MILIVDAYNVLKQLSSAQYITQAQRDAFIHKLSVYGAHKGHRIIIVFDGGSSKNLEKFRQSGVEVLYAGYSISADEVIKNLCDALRNQQVAVISSDRSLCAYISHNNIACIDAHLLQDLMQDAQRQEKTLQVLKTDQVARKREGHVSNSEIDALMQEGSERMLIKLEDQKIKKQKPMRSKPSKTEKKLKKLVNKL